MYAGGLQCWILKCHIRICGWRGLRKFAHGVGWMIGAAQCSAAIDSVDRSSNLSSHDVIQLTASRSHDCMTAVMN